MSKRQEMAHFRCGLAHQKREFNFRVVTLPFFGRATSIVHFMEVQNVNHPSVAEVKQNSPLLNRIKSSAEDSS